MKITLLTLVFTFASLVITNGQELQIKALNNDQVVHLLNNSDLLTNCQTFNLSIKVFKVVNLPGNSGADNGEITNDLYIAISEFGEVPVQKVFTISSIYNPKFISWDTKNQKKPELSIEYGQKNERKKITLQISIDSSIIKK